MKLRALFYHRLEQGFLILYEKKLNPLLFILKPLKFAFVNVILIHSAAKSDPLGRLSLIHLKPLPELTLLGLLYYRYLSKYALRRALNNGP